MSPNASVPTTNGKDMPNKAIVRVFEAMQAQWLSSCLGVMLDLHVPEILASSGKPLSVEEIAQRCDAAPQGTEHLYKVLRALAQWELIDEQTGRVFAPNAATTALVRGDEPSLGHLAAHQINKPKQQAWMVGRGCWGEGGTSVKVHKQPTPIIEMLPEAVRTGQTAFLMAHEGMNMYQYCEKTENKAFATEFNKSMTFFTQHSLEGGEHNLQNAFDWSNTRVVMDVGGGQGEMLSRCMHAAGPQAKGVLLDRPHVLEGVDLQRTFEAKGISPDRLQRVPGDVFEPFPQAAQQAGVDTLVMKHFLSAFNDAQCHTILKHCGQALKQEGHLLLFQTLVPEPGDTQHNMCKDGVMPGLFAIEILAQCPGGAWRTLSEWKAVFAREGFELQGLKEVGASMHLMVWGRS